MQVDPSPLGAQAGLKLHREVLLHPIPKITIQIPRTLTGGKTSSHGGYTSSSLSKWDGTCSTSGTSSSKSHHSHSSSVKIKSSKLEGSVGKAISPNHQALQVLEVVCLLNPKDLPWGWV